MIQALQCEPSMRTKKEALLNILEGGLPRALLLEMVRASWTLLYTLHTKFMEDFRLRPH